MFRIDIFAILIFILYKSVLGTTVYFASTHNPEEFDSYGHDGMMKSGTETEREDVKEIEEVLFRLDNIMKNSTRYFPECAKNNIIEVNNNTSKDIIIKTFPTFYWADCIVSASVLWRVESSNLTIKVQSGNSIRFTGTWQCKFVSLYQDNVYTINSINYCSFEIQNKRTKQQEIFVTNDYNGSNVYNYKTGDRVNFRCVRFGVDLPLNLIIEGSHEVTTIKLNDTVTTAVKFVGSVSPFVKASCVYKTSERIYRVERILRRMEVPVKNKLWKAPKNLINTTNYSQTRSESEHSYHADLRSDYNTWIYIIVPTLFVLACVFIAYMVLRGRLTKRKYIKHTSTNVVYETRTQTASPENSETSLTLKPSRVSSDSATYVTMTPGETPSVVHYLLPTRVNRAEILMKKLDQDKLLGYVTMNSTSDNTAHNSSEQNLGDVNHGYLTMKPASHTVTSNVSDVQLETPSIDVTVNEIVYEECYAGRLNIFGAEKQ